METQTSAEISGTSILPSLASSVLRNVFGGSQAVDTSTEESSRDSLMERPSEIATDVLTRLETRKERAATELGISAEEVESLPFDLSTLESEGIFMNIDCRGFGSLVRQLEWKTLGVQLPENAAVRVSPPRAGLLPDTYRNKLMRGAAQAHNALNRYGFRFTLCGAEKLRIRSEAPVWWHPHVECRRT